jgi:hypothetical protein
MINKIAALVATLAIATPTFAVVIDRGAQAGAHAVGFSSVGKMSNTNSANKSASVVEKLPAPRWKKRRR